MKAKERLAGLGLLLIAVAGFLILASVVAVFFEGAAWASERLLPWFQGLSWIALGVVVFIFLPLAISRKTRVVSAVALFIASYVFGATLWMEGLLLTLSIWGLTGVIIGVLMAGVGVVPVAMLATLLNSMWSDFFDLVLLAILTIGSRVGGMSLAESLER